MSSPTADPIAEPAKQRTLAVLQPGYLPWLGFFDQLRRSDVFVLYDDVQFDKHGWRNRNRIEVGPGPDLADGSRAAQGPGQAEHSRCRDRAGHLGAQARVVDPSGLCASTLPFALSRELEQVLQRPYTRLVDLDLALIDSLARWFGLERTIVRSSALGIDGGRSDRLLALCRHFRATHYLSGNAAKDYLSEDLFRQQGIEVVWQEYQHPVYPQLHGEFVPYLSAVGSAC